MGLRAWGLGLRVSWGLGLRVYRVRAWGFGFRIRAFASYSPLEGGYLGDSILNYIRGVLWGLSRGMPGV